MTQPNIRRFVLTICCAAAGLLTACQTTPKISASGVPANLGVNANASLLISNALPGKIYAAIADVFSTNGFNLMSNNNDGWVFQRLGTKADSHRYGDFDSESVMMQATVQVTPYGDKWLVLLSLAAIRDYNDPLGGDVNPIAPPSSYDRDYQKMLDAAKKMLDQPAAP